MSLSLRAVPPAPSLRWDKGSPPSRLPAPVYIKQSQPHICLLPIRSSPVIFLPFFLPSVQVVKPLGRDSGHSNSLPYIGQDAIVFDHNGRGNNWAWGYTGVASHRGPGTYASERGGVGPAAAGAGEGGGMPSDLSDPRRAGGAAARVHGAASTAGKTSSAAGAHHLPTGPVKEQLWKRALAAIRRQWEACDSSAASSPANGPAHMVVLHSLGGGTGSGLGSRLLEALRDEYPKATILSVCVAPFSSGDTPLQYYNMALTLSTVSDCSDAAVFFANDDLLWRAKILRRQAAALRASSSAMSTAAIRAQLRAERGGGGGSLSEDGERVSTAELNDVAALALTGLLAPAACSKLSGAGGRGKKAGKARAFSGPAGEEEDPSLSSNIWQAWLERHKAGAGSGSGCTSGRPGKDVGPGWYDIRVDAEGEEEGEEDGGGDRDGWMRAAVSGSSMDSDGGEAVYTFAGKGAAAAAGGGSSGSAVRPRQLHNLDSSAVLEHLVPAPALKYLDVRNVWNVYANSGGSGGGRGSGGDGGGAASCVHQSSVGSSLGAMAGEGGSAVSPSASAFSIAPGLTWSDLTDNLTDQIPRYEGSGGAAGWAAATASLTGMAAGAAGKPVTTLRALLLARGAGWTDCDSVDPRMGGESSTGRGAGTGSTAAEGKRGQEGSGSAGGSSPSKASGSGRSVAILGSQASAASWPNLPPTEDWQGVSTRLSRVLRFPGMAGSSGRGTGSSRYGASSSSSFSADSERAAILQQVTDSLLLPAPAFPSHYSPALLRPSSSSRISAVRSLTLASNSDWFVPGLVHCCMRVEGLMRARAYLHHYARFGVDALLIKEAAESVLNTADAYAEACAVLGSGGGGGGGGSSGPGKGAKVTTAYAGGGSSAAPSRGAVVREY